MILFGINKVLEVKLLVPLFGPSIKNVMTNTEGWGFSRRKFWVPLKEVGSNIKFYAGVCSNIHVYLFLHCV